MSNFPLPGSDTGITIHPYYSIKEGKLEEFKKAITAIFEKVPKE